ncbi:7-keto-8-aminopelargonate synthetase [Pedobacter terrae]|uniref:7-keto-8-aminopelargonate synthetase n=1 Tax=Pedobacter terrae TaxID=405671 RepID=A0A1G7XTN6_9SPHI|nr:aminotransferase class I/II-fold pyridoxal phosphate-dependent enzyme [Pedobacter terrae]SDG87110.1 7-keto-8-aminopelargonate synthetase [Pedobacter terrae]
MRDLKSIDQPFSNKINIEGSNYLYFGGTAYLGIPQNQDFIDLYIEGIQKFGLNNGTSRTNNIQLGIYDDAEKVAAARYGSEAALITSSGYLAAQLTVKGLSTLGKIIYAPATHPALWLNDQPANQQSFNDWKKETIKLINASEEQNWVLVSNSMNNLFPEIYDFNFLTEIHPEKEIILIVDDSHGIGIHNNGMGALINLPVKSNIERIVVASMAKALGIDAGLVLGSNALIAKLKNGNIFIGASPPSAASLFAFIKAEKIYQHGWTRLQENIKLFTAKINETWAFEPAFPAFLTRDSTLADCLLKEKILISSFPYPKPESKPINRIILSSWHEKEDIEKLVAAINF